MDEVVRSTPSSAPMRSMTPSISATDAVAATAIRSISPLTECSTRTCGMPFKAAVTARASVLSPELAGSAYKIEIGVIAARS